jgi:hypothetical protein
MDKAFPLTPAELLRLLRLCEQFGYWNNTWADWYRWCPEPATEYRVLMQRVREWTDG